MVFSSMVFLWIFLPIVLTIYYLFNLIFKNEKRKRLAKNYFLLFASIIFYAWGGIAWTLIMIVSIIINFIGGMLISKIKNDRKFLRRFTLMLVIILNLAILFYFKYFNMVLIAIEQVYANPNDALMCITNIFNMQRTYAINIKDIVLPIGISFFTFQAMSYVFDIYLKTARPQKNILNFALYVVLFPQLIAGPIVKYSDIEDQILNRVETVNDFVYGIKRFIYGLGKKVIFANTCGLIVDNIWALELEHLGAIVSWLAVVSYALQIYYDFSGYSDMAIGLGHMFGFDFKENFNYPYIADSIIDFWRRWHISLSTWFKEYVYFPLGGSRKGTFKTYINIFIVFLLTGIWHGANWTFIFWGISYAILQIIERLFLGKLLKINKFKLINFIYVNFIVFMLWIPFRANTINDAYIFFNQLWTLKSDYSILTFLSMKVIVTLILGILLSGILQNVFYKIYKKIEDNIFICFIDFTLQVLILIYSIMQIVGGTYNPFIYFQF